METTILSIDPGYDRIGIAILTGTSGKETLIHSECFVTDKKESLDTRILVIGNHLEMLINKYKPNAMAIETVFFASNQKTVMGVSEARGVIKYIAMKSGIPVFEYTPLQVKIALTGDGRATKDSVAHMTERIIKYDRQEKQRKMGGKSLGIDDEIDAIAVGITHISHGAHIRNVKTYI